MENEARKYYLVNFTFMPLKGSASFPFQCAMYDFNASKSPKECYDEIYADINMGGDDDDKFKKFKCIITDMKLIS